jgi:hypothetical protein
VGKRQAQDAVVLSAVNQIVNRRAGIDHVRSEMPEELAV